MTIFDEATAVTRRADGLYDALPDARFAMVVPGGTAPSAINGGALLATVMRAVLAESPLPHPVATSAHFLRVAASRRAEVQVSWLKHGRTAATARAALIQDGQVDPGHDDDGRRTLPARTPPAQRAGQRHARRCAGWRADVDRAAAGLPRHRRLRRPRPVARHHGGADGTAGYAAQVEVLMDPATTGWRRDEPSGLPEMRGYFQLRDEPDPDPYVLAMAVDGAAAGGLRPRRHWLGADRGADLAHARGAVPGPLAVAARARHVSGGWFDEEAEVWDAAGRLVAQSRQLARVGRGRLRAPANGSAQAAVTADGLRHALDLPDEDRAERGDDGGAGEQGRVAAEDHERAGDRGADRGRAHDGDVDDAEVLGPVAAAGSTWVISAWSTAR